MEIYEGRKLSHYKMEMAIELFSRYVTSPWQKIYFLNKRAKTAFSSSSLCVFFEGWNKIDI